MAPSARPEWRWLYRESRPFARFQITSLMCIGTSSAAVLVQPLILKWMLDEVLPNRRWGLLAIVAALFLAAAVARTIFASLGTFLNTLGSKRMTFRIHIRLVRHVQSLSSDFHDRHPVGDLLQRLERDVMAVGQFASDVFPAIARIVVSTCLSVAAMLYLDWRVTAVVLPLLPTFTYVRHRYRVVLRKWADAVRDVTGQQSALLQEMLAGAVQIQLLGAERRVARHYLRASLKTIQQEILQRREELIYAAVSASVIALGTAAILGYGGARVLTGDLTVGGLVAFYAYIGRMFTPMNTAVGLFAHVIRTHASVRRLMELEQASDVVRDAPDATPLTSVPRVLAYRRVTFNYGPDKAVLQQADFCARAGDRVTIVGESGSGKSSLLKLAPRLYDAQDGCIELDGRDIRTIRLESLRNAISFVPQDPVLFQGTLLANLRYGCPTATLDEIHQAAWIACLTEVIDRLPEGVDTEIGRQGAGLSGGERQRVAIARALLQQRPILLLDEAFSALDNAAERRFLSRLEDWATGRIVIAVSHRLASAQWGDRVIVLHRGQVVEDSRHELLFRADTHYRALWTKPDHEEHGARARAR